MTPETFDRARLSAREDAILEAAIEGLTDIQIAQRLEITQSTVNSYWVRIRGKLGQLSRTELVALALKQRASSDLAEITARADLYQRQLEGHAQITEDFRNAEIHRAALDAMPEAVLVCCPMGLIRYANAHLEAMFGYGAGELLNQSVAILVPGSVRNREGQALLEYMKNPYPLRLGISNVVFGQRKNGLQFRIVLLLDGRPTSNGHIATCIVRDFSSEIDVRRRYASAAFVD